MKHAEELIKRILFLEGTPNMTRYDKIKVGDNVKKQLESDLQIELDAIDMLRPGIRLCLEELDHARRELLEHILVERRNMSTGLKVSSTLSKRRVTTIIWRSRSTRKNRDLHKP
jgi:bacterioferritin